MNIDSLLAMVKFHWLDSGLVSTLPLDTLVLAALSYASVVADQPLTLPE